jgi:hypothetical protein
MTAKYPGLIHLTHIYMTARSPDYATSPSGHIYVLGVSSQETQRSCIYVRCIKPGDVVGMYMFVRCIKPGDLAVMYIC